MTCTPTTIFFYADDLEKTYEELSAKGVEFPAKPVEQPWGWWAMFVDSEGNRFALQQR
jgi:predicted enzyme related to lactoylglutathione lyase